MRLLAISLALLLAGCMNMPTPSAEIGMSYLPLGKYEPYSCDALRAEADMLKSREVALVIAQEQRIRDSGWRSIIWGFGYGDGPEAEQLSNTRGEQEAVKRISVAKGC